MTNPRTVSKNFKGLVLIVDDSSDDRILVERALKLEGYQTISAVDGGQAVALFLEHKPDIVFMDVMMPIMNGYQVTARIKELAGAEFVPFFFMTTLTEEEALAPCLESGGDDFLSKPLKQNILRAKLSAMERIRNVSRSVDDRCKKIEMQHQRLLHEQVLAEQIYTRAITGDNILSNHIQYLSRAVSIFSGDLLLTAHNPQGKLHILLGDFTGHGLVAAVGMLPATEVFRVMTSKGFSPPEIMQAINSKLHKLLPTGMFMAACFVAIENDLSGITVWNAGMPDALVLGTINADVKNSGVKYRVVSQYLALGILNMIDLEPSPDQLSIASGDRILLCSDGVTEAVNSSGDEFGASRYEASALLTNKSFQTVLSALDNFRGNQEFNDDVSLVEVHCMATLLRSADD